MSQFYGREGPTPTMVHIDMKYVVHMPLSKPGFKWHILNNTIVNVWSCYLTFVVHAQLTVRATVLLHTFPPSLKERIDNLL